MKYTIRFLLANIRLYTHFSKRENKMATKIVSSNLKETPKLYIEIYYRILTSALFRDIDYQYYVVRSLGYL